MNDAGRPINLGRPASPAIGTGAWKFLLLILLQRPVRRDAGLSGMACGVGSARLISEIACRIFHKYKKELSLQGLSKPIVSAFVVERDAMRCGVVQAD